MSSWVYGLQNEQQYSSAGFTREMYAAVFDLSLLTFKILHKNPNRLFIFIDGLVDLLVP